MRRILSSVLAVAVAMMTMSPQPAFATQVGAVPPIAYVPSICDPNPATNLPPDGSPWKQILTVDTQGLGPPDYPETFAGLQSALNVWAADADAWYLVVVATSHSAHGQVITGTVVNGRSLNNSAITIPAKAGATKCLVIESSDFYNNGIVAGQQPALGQILCSHGLASQGGKRNPGCNGSNGLGSAYNDEQHLWQMQITPIGASGMHAIYACGGNNTTWGPQGTGTGPGPGGAYACVTQTDSTYTSNPANHVLIRDAEITLAPGSAQPTNGSLAPQLIQLRDGPTQVFLEYNDIHGWDAGDPGQPAALCSMWAAGNTSVATVAADGHGGMTVTRTSGGYFGPAYYPPGQGGYSTGAVVSVNGVNQTVIADDGSGVMNGLVAGTQNTQFTVSGLTATAGTVVNPNPFPKQYASGGCGDDVDEGIGFDATDSALQWNYVEKIHGRGTETHAVDFGFSQGPDKISHNWFEGGSIALFSGGAEIDIRGGPANDMEIRGNHLGHDLNWRFITGFAGNSPGPPFGCGPANVSHSTPAMSTCVIGYGLKNNFELKLGNRVLADGNEIEDMWADGQSGFCSVIDPRTASGGDIAGIFNLTTGLPTTIIANVTLTNNWFANCPQAHQLTARSLTPSNGGGVSAPQDYDTVQNNVYSNVGDPNQFNNPGRLLIDLGGGGSQDYQCATVGNGTTETFTCQGMVLASCNPPGYGLANACPAGTIAAPACSNGGANNCGILGNSVSATYVSWAGTCDGTHPCIVEVQTGSRLDPIVGGTVIVYGPAAAGTFTVVAVTTGNKGTVATPCSSPDQSQPQPCLRFVGSSANGIFGNTFFYSDTAITGGPNSAYCISASACAALNFNFTLPSWAYSITDISVADLAYTPYCLNAAAEVGAISPVLATTGTNPAGLTVVVPSTFNGSTICDLENNAGHPVYSIFNNNAVLSPIGLSIYAAGAYKQFPGFQLEHNIFASPTNPTGWTAPNYGPVSCGSTNSSWNAPLTQCWGTTTGAAGLTEQDNLIVNQTTGTAPNLGSGSVYSNTWVVGTPGGSTTCTQGTTNCAPNSTIGSGNAYLNWLVSPSLGACSYDGTNPLNCPLMGAPWSSNFSIQSLVSSTWTAEGPNIANVNTAMTQLQYVCAPGTACYEVACTWPGGANPSPGPCPDLPGSPRPPTSPNVTIAGSATMGGKATAQ